MKKWALVFLLVLPGCAFDRAAEEHDRDMRIIRGEEIGETRPYTLEDETTPYG